MKTGLDKLRKKIAKARAEKKRYTPEEAKKILGIKS